MHILLITWNYPPKVGGMENMLSQLVAQWRATEHVTVIGPFAVSSSDDLTIRPSRKGLVWFMAASFASAAKIIKKNRVAVIIAGSALLTPLAITLGFLFRVPVVSQVHGLDVIYKKSLYQALIRFFLPRSTLVFANSNNTKKLAISVGVQDTRVEVVNPGLSFSEFEKLPEVASLQQKLDSANRKILLSAGRLAPRKGIPEFIENVLPLLCEKHSDVLYVIAGENPTQSLTHKEDVTSRILKSIDNNEMSDHVRVLGYVNKSELLQLYALADIFILPAIPSTGDVEGFGIVLIEAGAAGCPVVSVSIGGISDAVENNRSGILLNPNDWSGMVDAIDRLLQNHELRESMGKYSRLRVKEHFDWSVIGPQYLSRITKLLEHQNR